MKLSGTLQIPVYYEMDDEDGKYSKEVLQRETDEFISLVQQDINQLNSNIQYGCSINSRL